MTRTWSDKGWIIPRSLERRPIDDVRSMTAEDIRAHIDYHDGDVAKAAGEIAAAGLRQLQNVRLVVDPDSRRIGRIERRTIRHPMTGAVTGHVDADMDAPDRDPEAPIARGLARTRRDVAFAHLDQLGVPLDEQHEILRPWRVMRGVPERVALDYGWPELWPLTDELTAIVEARRAASPKPKRAKRRKETP